MKRPAGDPRMKRSAGADVQASFCTVLVDEWARAGVKDAVVSPGSRSTPLIVALGAERRIGVHVVLDERSAGFVALGLGLASGRPALVVTTSGTAAVELHPAVVEAHHAGVALIAVTADRPPELQDVGAPQTVSQERLYGPAVNWETSPGVADAAAAGSWRSLASRAVAEAHGSAGRAPGPVHLNLAFREPLLGSPAGFEAPAGRPAGAPWHGSDAASPPGRGPSGRVVELLRRHAGGRGVIVAGAGAGDPAAWVGAATRLGWPLLADPRSGCRVPAGPVIAAADALLRVPEVAGWAPEIVLRVGAPWASKALSEWLAGLPPSTPQILVDRWGRWRDPERGASEVLACEPGALAAALCAALPAQAPVTAEWVKRWRTAELAAQRALDGCLGAGRPFELSEPAVARALLGGVPEGGQVVVASSMPVRDLEWYGEPRSGVRVLANRGANGIDGVVSTAVGAALWEGRPTVALVGDLAFLHDAGALLGATSRGLALTVVVIDNAGGGIFSFLPQAASLPEAQFERYWGTPQPVRVGAVAAAYGPEVVEVRARAALDQVVAGAGCGGVRVAIVTSDRRANVEVHDRLHEAVRSAVVRG
ncbi:MAG: 2-succinyl-5-enolpyruvyl-6-hydroxy-3-cyclohexene-1-carboxylic-acid synthase [Acidimicrobiales bacterium]